MTNIDAISLATVVGGKAAAPAPTKPTTKSTSTQQPDPQVLGNDALTGCLQGLGSVKSGSGSSPTWQQLGVTCAIGAGEGILKGIGSIFGAPSSSGSTKSK